MKDWIWPALLGVGGYFLYEYLKGQGVIATATTPVPGTTPIMQGQISVVTPTGGSEPTAAQLANQLNRLTASPSDWNGAYTTLTGRSIDTLYGFNFNAVYGSVGNSTITPDVFLGMARATGMSPHITLSGFGRGSGPIYSLPSYLRR